MTRVDGAEAEARARKLAGRLGCVAALGFGIPIAMMLLLANALIPCSHAGDCKPMRGGLLMGLAVVMALGAGAKVWRRMVVVLPARVRELAEGEGE